MPNVQKCDLRVLLLQCHKEGVEEVYYLRQVVEMSNTDELHGFGGMIIAWIGQIKKFSAKIG